MDAVGIHSASEKTKIKRRRNKTLAKSMLYNRLLNCRDSGLLEQSIASKRRSGALTKQAFLPPLDECGRYALDPEQTTQ